MSVRFRMAVLIPAVLFSLIGAGVSSASAAPANDNFASAQVLAGAPPLTVAGNNIGATVEAGEPTIYSNTPLRTVWYRWTATSTGTFVLDSCDDGFTGGPAYEDPMMGVRTGATLGTLVNVAEINGRCSLRFAATIGTIYSFQVDYHDLEGNFNLTLRPLSPPANNNFATPTTIGPALPISVNSSTVDATYEAGEPPSLGGSSDSRSVWFAWTAPASQRVRLSLCEKTFVDGPLNDRVLVYTGNTLGTLVTIADLGPSDCNMDFAVVAGTTYRIAVSGSIKGEFLFTMTLKAAPPPANDNFATPQVAGPGLPVNLKGDNDFATEEAGEPDNHGGYPGTSRSVWYSWTAGVSGRIRVKTCGEGLNLPTSVYTGATLATLTDVSEGSNWTVCSRYFDSVAGTTYRIAVAGTPSENTHGPFDLNIHEVSLPANDSFAGALDLGSGLKISQPGTTVDATTEASEPDHASYYGSSGGSVWYRWTAPDDKPVVLSACSPELANRITVYDQDPDPFPGALPIQAIRLIDEDAEFCRGGEKGGRLAIAPAAGTKYWIVVTPADEDYESAFTLKIEGTTSTVTPKPSAFNLKKAIAKCKKIKGKGKKARRQRTKCIKAARKKAAIIKCKKLQNSKKRNVCLKKARKKFR